MNPISEPVKKRNLKIDALRFICIISIFLAHSKPENAWVAQLRIFDVVLMVLLLANSFYVSAANKKISYVNYVKKRFNRLVIPTWIFLTIFFAFFFLLGLYVNGKHYFDLSTIIRSYLLLDGIGFVWIMRVFLLVSLLCPFILKVSNKIKSNIVFLLLTVALFPVYLLLSYLAALTTGLLKIVILDVVVYGMGYGLIAALGIRMPRLDKAEKFFYGLFFLLTFLFLTFIHDYIPTELQKYKYPPQLYYVSYGLFVSFFLYLLMEVKFIQIAFQNQFVRFVSRTSAWLYFWHIIPFYIIKIFGHSMPSISANSTSRFMFILPVAVLLTYTHEVIKASVKQNRLWLTLEEAVPNVLALNVIKTRLAASVNFLRRR